MVEDQNEMFQKVFVDGHGERTDSILKRLDDTLVILITSPLPTGSTSSNVLPIHVAHHVLSPCSRPKYSSIADRIACSL